MTTYDYYSIPFRMGILISMLSCVAIGNVLLHLADVLNGAPFKCLIALWVLVGFVGLDIAKNGIRQWRRQTREQASLLRAGAELAEW